MDKSLLEEVLCDEPLLAQGSFLKVRRLTVRLPNGAISTRDKVHHPGASAMLALDAQGRIVLERQWRAPLNRAFWEVPAGKIDEGESAFDCAKRELAEEAGLHAQRWTFLGTLHNAIGYSDEHIEIFLAEELKRTRVHRDANEFLRLRHFTWQEALRMTTTGEITDVKTICALMWLERYLAGNLPQAVLLSPLITDKTV